MVVGASSSWCRTTSGFAESKVGRSPRRGSALTKDGAIIKITASVACKGTSWILGVNIMSLLERLTVILKEWCKIDGILSIEERQAFVCS